MSSESLHASKRTHAAARPFAVEGLESRVLLSMAPDGPTFQVNAPAPLDQALLTNQRSVAMSATGDFVVVWESNLGIPYLAAQRFNAFGVAQGAEIRVTPGDHLGQFFASVAMDAGGNFVVAWNQQGAIVPTGIWLQRFNADGAKQGFHQFISPGGAEPSVAMDPDGDYVVAWAQPANVWDVHAMRFDALGNLKGNLIVANFHVEVENQPAVAAAPDGGFVVTWRGWRGDGFEADVYEKAFDFAGQPRGGEFRANTTRPGNQEHQRVAVDQAGNFVVVWHSTGGQDGDGAGVYGRRFNPQGIPLAGEFLVNTTTAGSQIDPNIAMDNAGNFTVAWNDRGRATARSFDPAANPDGPEFWLSGSNNTADPDIAMDFNGDFAAVWTGQGNGRDVYAQRFGQPDPVRNTIEGQKFNDLNANSIKDAGEPGMANWSIYHDRNNNSQFDTGSYTDIRGVGTVLPSRGTRRYLGPGPGSAAGAMITDVNIRLNVQFPTDGELTAWVISPGGRRVELFSNVGSNGDNFIGTEFDDASPVPITIGVAPFTGGYKPEQPLSAFNGELLTDEGYWMLEIQNPGNDFGLVMDWGVTVGHSDNVALTDSNGNYRLTVPPGASTVRERPQAGWAMSFPFGGGHFLDIAGRDQTVPGKDFGNTRADTIHGTKYLDVNADGGIDPVDPVLAGATIYIDANGNEVLDYRSDTVASTEQPVFIAGGVVAGSIVVSGFPSPLREVYVNLDITFSRDDHLDVYLISPSGNAVELFTDVGANGQNFTNTTLRDGAPTGIAAGAAPFTGTYRPERPLASLAGEDPNGQWQLQVIDDGVFHQGTLNSWSVTIAAGELNAVTDASGKYVISNVPAGTHLLREVLPPGWIQTYPGSGPQTVIHTAGQFHRFHNFGNAYAGTISGGVFNDDNADGVNNPGEDLLGGFTIYADLNNNGQFDPTDPSTTSTNRFGYVLNGIPIEEPITLREIPPFSAGTQWEISTAPAPVELTFAQPRASLRNFGAFRRGSIAGFKFHDFDGDGTFDALEPGLQGWTVYLDENRNGQLDGGAVKTASRDVPKTVSRPVQSELPVRGLIGAVTDVDVTLGITYADLRLLTLELVSPSGRTVRLYAGEGRGENFTGTTFDDEAEKGFRDGTAPYEGSFIPAQPLSELDGEDPNGTWLLRVTNAEGLRGSLDDWSLTLTTAGERTTTTDATGRYVFGGLRPGGYAVREQQQSGWTQTTPPGGAYNVVVTSGQDVGGFDFGNRSDNVAPRVTQVYANGTGWSAAFRNYLPSERLGSGQLGFAMGGGAAQLLDLPWQGVNQISVVFTHDVVIGMAHLAVRGVNVANYPVAAFSYDAPNHTATWTLAQEVAADKLMIDLDGSVRTGVRAAGPIGMVMDGDWTTGDAYPSGDGAAGGDFLFRVNVLRGDADRAFNRVNAADLGYVKARLNRSTTSPTSPTGGAPYTVFADVTADGRVNAADQGLVKARLNSGLPVANPLAVASDTLLAEFRRARENDPSMLLA